MTQFLYWYTYFDSIFLRKEPTANRTLAQMIGPDIQQWPSKSSLPQLSACFDELQSFILDEKNWSESICTIDELNKIQSDVTNLLVLLEIQKMYMRDFWSSRRRIEASVTHLYALLQIFMSSIIPYNTMTLFQCKAANKLCVRITNLQDLFKSLMKKINSICAFFSHQYFSEENQILRNFFENFVAFMKSIPKIKKARMFHVSQLLKYIMIINTLQITANAKPNLHKTKSKNFNKKQIEQAQEEVRIKSCQKMTKKVGDSYWLYVKSKKRQKSCPHKDNSQDKQIDYISKAKSSLRFIFPSWIRRHSIKHRKQTIPKLHIESHFTKGKSNTQGVLKSNNSEQQNSKRNKSATKSRIRKSPTSAQLPSPMTRLYFSKQLSSVEKFSLYQNPFEEDEQNCLFAKIQSQSKLRSSQPFNLLVLVQQLPKYLCLESMSIIDKSQDKRMENMMKHYIALKQIQNIIGQQPIRNRIHEQKHPIF